MIIGNFRRTWLRKAVLGCAAGALLIGTVSQAAAQDAAAPPPDPDKVTLNFFKGTEIGGLVDGYYDWFSTKSDGVYRNFDVKHNSFTANMAEIWVAKAPATDSPLGYKVRLNFGPAASNFIAFAEPTTPLVNVEEAYGSYMAPAGKGLQIDFGKFVTNAGAEVIEAKDNWNYSRSLLFALAIPYYHAGIRLTYSPTDKVTLMGGVVNGWNNAEDNNTGKTVMASVTFKPNGATSIIENYIGGPETTGTNDNFRNLSDTVVSFTVDPKLSVMGNVDFGKDGDSKWWGVAGYLKYQATDMVAVVPRVEYYDDKDAFSTGIVQKLKEATVTLEIKPTGGFMWRIEYRGDFSDQAVFTSDTGAAKKNQQSISFGFLYSFSSKS
jgi:hypothetical protein